MMIDASALVAIMLNEREARAFSDSIEAASRRITHALSIYEASLAVARVRRRSPEEARKDVLSFLSEARIQTADIGLEETAAAIQAFARYGKGNHAAGLNMGDCFSYAIARTRGLPLLYKGDDFARTDLA